MRWINSLSLGVAGRGRGVTKFTGAFSLASRFLIIAITVHLAGDVKDCFKYRFSILSCLAGIFLGYALDSLLFVNLHE
jgi:hypothetical protein